MEMPVQCNAYDTFQVKIKPNLKDGITKHIPLDAVSSSVSISSSCFSSLIDGVSTEEDSIFGIASRRCG